MIQRVFPILALAMFSSNLGMGVVTPLLPLYVQSLGATGIWVGAIMAGYGASCFLATPFFGRLSDRRGRKLFLCVGLICYSVLSLGYIWSNNVVHLVLLRLLQGAAGGMVTPIAIAYVGDLSPRGEEGRWMGYANAAFFGGFGVGPLLGGVLTDHFGMVSAFSSMGGFNLLAFLVALFLLPVVEVRLSRGDTPSLSFREMTRSSMVRGLFSFQLSQAFCRGGFISFVPLFAAARAGLSPTLIGVILSINLLLTSALGPIGGNIADRFNRKVLAMGGNSLFILSMVLVPFAGNFWLLLIVAAASAVGGGLSLAAASALAVDEGRKYGMGSTMGVTNMGMFIGFALGPVIAGGIVDFTDISAAFYLGSLVMFIGTILFAWLTRR